MKGKPCVGLALLLAPLIAAGRVAYAGGSESGESPRWSYEIRGGEYRPDLGLFETFYGRGSETYYGLAGSHRFKNWLEVGGEFSQMRTKGVGLLTSSQLLGGSVTYRLRPMHIYCNFVFQRRPAQRVVPYAGLGLAQAAYEQKVELQSDVNGHTDLGYAGRVGVRFSIAARMPSGAAQDAGAHWVSYLFVEAQRMSFKIDDIELGGTAYVLGFRMEFDYPGP